LSKAYKGNSIDPILFDAALVKVSVTFIRIYPVNIDFIDYSLIRTPANTSKNKCYKKTEAKTNWLEEGF
jgi:hypothetical protein